MLKEQLEKIKAVQREAWNKSSEGWKKWDEHMMRFLKPVGDEIISLLHLKDNFIVLDVATGTGEPGLTIASLLKNGSVVGTDLSENMLAVAMEKAKSRELKNFETLCCEVSELPFSNETFDAISCRMSFMLFPDIQIALDEMLRVLKPGGRLAISFWNSPEENFWISNSMEIMIRMLELKPAPGAPGPFRCAQKGMVAQLFSQAGLKNIEEKTVTGKMSFSDQEEYWKFITEAASPVAFAKADENLKQQIKSEVLSGLMKKFPDGKIIPGSSATVLGAQK